MTAPTPTPPHIQVLALAPGARLPERASQLAAGWDVRASAGLTLEPGQRALVPTGLAVALPPGFELQIRPRSGLALEHGVTVLNAPGTIDADYRGELRILLVNLGQHPFRIEPGDRIAQAVLAQHAVPTWSFVEALPETTRGSGGFGHTGTR